MAVFAAVFWVTLRSLLRGRRLIVLGALAVLPVVVMAGDRFNNDGLDPIPDFVGVVRQLVLAGGGGIAMLIVSAAAFGDDREDGLLTYLVARPVERLWLVLAKGAAGAVAGLLVVVPSAVLTWAVIAGVEGPVGGDPVGLSLLAGSVGAAAAAAVAYAAVFGWVALVVRRPVLVGLVYVLLWEGAFVTFADSADRLSIRAYAEDVLLNSATGSLSVSVDNTPELTIATALFWLALASVAAIALATRRLRRMDVA